MVQPLDNIEEQTKWEQVRMFLYILEVSQGEDACIDFLTRKIEERALKASETSTKLYYSLLEGAILGFEMWLEDVPYFTKAKDALMIVVNNLKESAESETYMSVRIKMPQIEEELKKLEILTRVTKEEMADFRKEVNQMKQSERMFFITQVIEAEAQRKARADGKTMEEVLRTVALEAKIKMRLNM